jgi:hypothetical protein
VAEPGSHEPSPLVVFGMGGWRTIISGAIFA